MKAIWNSIPAGTIVDSDIEALVKEGELIIGDYEAKRVRQACYELRASTIFYETWSDKLDKRIDVGVDGAYLLRPRTYVVAIVLENIRLPSNVMGRILTKGVLFSVGLLPVNTYADPGFEGQLGITLCNMSNGYLRVRPGTSIAKIEFSKLAHGVAHPYAGQHGYQTKIWPMPTDMLVSRTDLRSVAGVRSDVEELELSYGPAIAGMERRLRYYERVVWIQIALTVACFGLVLALFGSVGPFVAITLGILANLVTTVGVNALHPLRRRFSWLG